jgi:hypothetical protein
MESGKFSFKFSRQTQKNLVGSSKYAYFSSSSNYRLFAFLKSSHSNNHTGNIIRVWHTIAVSSAASVPFFFLHKNPRHILWLSYFLTFRVNITENILQHHHQHESYCVVGSTVGNIMRPHTTT